ncbi:MAG: SUMF1/EgtB/PvdO family nonheme iron enzyme [Caldilineaceae bacterium]|nr:SUMF1/EgtB/PvdO family nonheme iron enzyme [Caldilineaceae bacterium]
MNSTEWDELMAQVARGRNQHWRFYTSQNSGVDAEQGNTMWANDVCLVCQHPTNEAARDQHHNRIAMTVPLCRRCQFLYTAKATDDEIILAPVGLRTPADLEAALSQPDAPNSEEPRWTQYRIAQALLTVTVAVLCTLFSVGIITNLGKLEQSILALPPRPTPIFVNLAIPQVLHSATGAAPATISLVASIPEPIGITRTLHTERIIPGMNVPALTLTKTMTTETSTAEAIAAAPVQTETVEARPVAAGMMVTDVLTTTAATVTGTVPLPTAPAQLTVISPTATALITATTRPTATVAPTATIVPTYTPSLSTEIVISVPMISSPTSTATTTLPLTETLDAVDGGEDNEGENNGGEDDGGNGESVPALPAAWDEEMLVRIDDFLIAKDVVTVAQYGACVEAGVCTAPSGVRGDSDTGAEPVTYLTWTQAQEYATYVGGRLPRASEWQRACLAGAFAVDEQSGTVWEWTIGQPDADTMPIFDRADCTTSLTREVDEQARRLGFRIRFPLP